MRTAADRMKAAGIVQDGDPVLLKRAEPFRLPDEQCQGCLSFFDVRGLVLRPLHIEVACTRPNGQQYVLALDNAMARLAAHEINHLGEQVDPR